MKDRMNFQSLRDRIKGSDASLILGNVRVPACMIDTALPIVADGLVQCDVEIRQNRLSVKPPGQTDAASKAFVDCGNRMVWALPVDAHTHIDKGQIWARTKNHDGSFQGALAAGMESGGAYRGEQDLRMRASFMLGCAAVHGTRAIRTHVDAETETIDTKMAVLGELAQDYEGVIDVQLAPFVGVGDDPAFVNEVARISARQPKAVLSAFLYMDSGLVAFVDTIIGLAERYGLGLDFHADETLDAKSNCLAIVADRVLKHRFSGPVLVGHCCALSVQDEASVMRTIELVAKAGLGVVALPLCNAYLQDRGHARSPRQRGVAPLKELRAAGVRTAIASDNVRDHFYAYGDMDVPELFRDALRFMQLDHPVGDWPATVSCDAASLLGHDDFGKIKSGQPADLMMFPARNWSEFAARPLGDRIVMRGGRVQTTELPEFTQLDSLEMMMP